MAERPFLGRRWGKSEWAIFALILAAGFACIIVSAEVAIRMPREWEAAAGMSSEMDPDRVVATPLPIIEPLRPEIMTPLWDLRRILTPLGPVVVVVPPQIFAPVPTATATPQTIATATPALPSPPPTSLPSPTPSPPPTPTRPRPTATFTPSPSLTPTSSPTPIPPTSQPTSTSTPTPTPTHTPTPTSTPTHTPTPVPFTLRAAAGSNEVSLGWDAIIPTPLAYRVYRANGGPFIIITETVETAYPDTSVTNGSVYTYYVAALDAGGREFGLSNLVQVQPYNIGPYTTTNNVTCEPANPNCNLAGGTPDGQALNLGPNQAVILDFGEGTGIIDGPGPDMVFYEWPHSPGILLDFIIIEISADGSTWYTVFAWDGVTGGVLGTNVDTYAADGEQDNEPIPSDALYPYPGTGITIDIGIWAPAGYSYRYVRLQCPANGGDAAQVDAVQRLH